MRQAREHPRCDQRFVAWRLPGEQVAYGEERHQAEQQRTILGGARKRPHRIERLRQRHRACFAQHAARTQDAGAVDARIQATQKIFGGGYVLAHLCFGGDIGLKEAGMLGTQFRNRRCAFVRIDIEQGDLAAVGNQVLGHGKTETGDAAGDHGADVGELHGESLRAETRDFSGCAPQER